MSHFHRDNDGQKRVRDTVLIPCFYEGKYRHYVLADGGPFAKLLQDLAVDTILQRHGGLIVSVEEKIVRWRGSAYIKIALETMACTVEGKEKKGMMHYGKCDWLLYGMCQENGDLLVYIIRFGWLKEAFWPEVESFDEIISDQKNQTICRLVPLDWIREKSLMLSEFRLVPPPAGREAVIAYNKERSGDSGWKRPASLGA